VLPRIEHALGERVRLRGTTARWQDLVVQRARQ
jgi:hypothetical protein